ncbi:MAG: hypothetical protein AW09_002138 [Candidatus Accumulibacter phosphatis]|uniref:DUF2934 domain-containing protein n=1 Tax=Candidatus Accumulibacter phosphatis TaxID=327160 RepID=A0A080LXT5_9PROT|nr:DUF2934 domain-containing protein [Accumulibacter sp.]KFB72665.1 MAG: hypothetical protein AW09_002138 [Candidatus Accumulibacter phosphatis]HRF11233.1 DUF2934 domain-containing protein [Candidatus Accumulibacter phosphatis]
MTEEKSTTKRAPAARKTTTATATASTAGKTPAVKAAAVKKPAAAAAPAPAPAPTAAAPAPQKMASPKPAATAIAAEIESLQSAPTECAAPVAMPVKPSPEDRYRMVQSAAYFIAERDGFRGADTDYWAQAEGEIAAQLGEA